MSDRLSLDGTTCDAITGRGGAMSHKGHGVDGTCVFQIHTVVSRVPCRSKEKSKQMRGRNMRRCAAYGNARPEHAGREAARIVLAYRRTKRYPLRARAAKPVDQLFFACDTVA
ncbi:hypothetical protein [Nitrobacter sp.]|uniref:hypothetical protein n=1 Tax=Nitrobacter sp. TaxID=29420 RepID=UPI00399D674B